MSDSTELVCKPTKWFLWRAVAMAVMFGVGAFMFFKDWKWGYPEKNVERYHFLAFEQAKEDFAKHLEEGKSPAEWEEYASTQKIFRPVDKDGEKVEEVAPTVPADTDFEKTWPDILADFETYSPLYEQGKNIASPPGWKEFSNSGGRKWDEKSADQLKSEAKIKEQLYIGIFCTVLFVLALFFFLRTLGRSMKVDSAGFTAPGGKLIPYGDIKRIDARKWDTKGLAYLYYNDGGSEKKAKVDGMVYGQFKKEEGEPAQKLYDRILSNFHGELIELAPEEDEEPENEEKKVATNDSE
ncbi:hypothetical protein AAFN60_16335 [Roseibacillus persicicus]|uniref:hypothetical protein n=1 Tax=Roseibacillus persicicus TaxID=454148 RepID=UPI00398AB9C8